MGSPQGEISAVEQGIPLVDVASIFQKDPQVLIAHPDNGVDKFEDLVRLGGQVPLLGRVLVCEEGRGNEVIGLVLFV
ncbi:ABC transporter substrate-binding protein, partial [Rhizobium johnstonii]|uniref:ABC transporter substrate-binding protein n=1 Tax=Rhizobium johnstonii TaxID=3019933 RepID=UPI003F94E900